MKRGRISSAAAVVLARLPGMIGHEIQVAELRVGHRDPVADVGGEGPGVPAVELVRTRERVLGLVVPTQLVQHDPPVEVGLGVRRVLQERQIEVRERFLEPSQHREAQPGLVPHVGEMREILEDLEEGRHGALVVVALPGADAARDVLSRLSRVTRHCGPPVPPASGTGLERPSMITLPARGDPSSDRPRPGIVPFELSRKYGIVFRIPSRS